MSENISAAKLPADLPEILQQTLDLLSNRQAEDITIYDLRGTSLLSDFCLLCTARSIPHIRALIKHIEKLFKENSMQPTLIEGTPASRWIVMVYRDIIIHIFDPDTREFYELEALFKPASCIYPEMS